MVDDLLLGGANSDPGSDVFSAIEITEEPLAPDGVSIQASNTLSMVVSPATTVFVTFELTVEKELGRV